MIQSITVIGCGSLGGYLAQSLSQLEEIDKLVLIDFDKVESKNLKNSIYRKEDIGEDKVVALKKIIKLQRENIHLEIINNKFIENELYIPNTNLTIDCRDFIYDRGNYIDARLYISSRYLIIDGRQDISFETHHKGRYIQELTKTDLRNAAFSASLFINKGLIIDVIDKKIIHKIELDYLARDMYSIINTISKKPDSVYDYNDNDKKLLHLYENIETIISMNAKKPIGIYIGDRLNPIISSEVSIGKFKDSKDVVEYLISMIDIPFSFNQYLVSPGMDNNTCYVELLPETGAA